jgi:peptide/nickel transport system substrate-binding protein
MSKHAFSRRGRWLAPWLVGILSATLLAACGESAAPTATPGAALPSPTAAGTPIQAGQQSAFVTPTGGVATTAAAATTAPATTVAASATTAVPATTSAATQAKPGGTLKLTVATEPNSLDPAKTVLAAANAVNSLIYDRLVYIGKDGLPKPWLAESWQIGDGGKLLTFKIRTGVKFHDDTPLNAQAVKFTFDRLLDPKTASPAKSFLGSLETVEAPDETTVIFKFKEPFAAIFTNLSIAYNGIVSPTAVEKSGEQYPRNPVGSGPFKFKSWQTGREIVLERNASYKNFREDIENKGAPYVEQITLTVIPEAATQLAALESGSLDVVAIQADNAPRITKDERFNVIQIKTSIQLWFLDFADKAPFNNLEFRKAVSHAVDRKTIVESAASGFASAATSPLPNGVAGHDPNINPYPFDPAKAKTILKEAGWTPGANGILEKDGKPASFTIVAPAGDSTTKRAAEVVQANLKEIGLDAKVQIQELSALVGQLGKGEFDMVLLGVGWSDPSYLSIVYKSKNIAVLRAEDKELDALLTKADTTLEPTARLALVKDGQKAVLDRAKVTPLYSLWGLTAVQKKVQGLKLDALFNILYNDIWLS